MDDLSAVLQKAFLAQGPLLELSRPQPQPPRPPHGSHLSSHADYRRERSGKKVRSNRLDQILYKKLNVDHLAPAEAPEPGQGPPAAAECPRVPGLLDPSRGAAPDLRGGILGELLTKADPLRTVFAAGSYAFTDLGLDASLKPLNLSKAAKGHAADLSPTYCPATSTASAGPGLPPQTELGLAGLPSLGPALPPAMSSLLAPNMISPAALASLTSSSSMLASLGRARAATPTTTTTLT